MTKLSRLALLLTAALLGACVDSHETPERLSPDLSAQLALAAAAEPVDVIALLAPAAADIGCGLDALEAEVLHAYAHTGALALSLPADRVDELSACPGVAWVAPDRETRGFAKPGAPAPTGDTDLALRATGAASVSETGFGVGVALLDSGVFTAHRALGHGADRVDVEVLDFLDGAVAEPAPPTDGYGHGTLSAGGVASRTPGAAGLAPDAHLVVLRVLDADGVGRTSDAIAALEWLMDHGEAYGVRVVNLSVGAPVHESYTRDPLCQAAEAAVRSGLVVVAAAGNLGADAEGTLFGGIVSPANHPAVITVGAADTAGTALRSDDAPAWFSSRGPTLVDGVAKPDLLAPGTDLVLPSAPGSAIARVHGDLAVRVPRTPAGHPWMTVSGTSFAAPLVSGAAALLLEAQPDLNPTEVKAILQLTAQALPGVHELDAGAGLLNAAGAVRLASQWNTDPTLQAGDPNLLGAAPEPYDVIEGETVLWGNGLIWNGIVELEPRFHWGPVGWWNLGDLTGSGIIWNGLRADAGELVWMDWRIQDPNLYLVRQEWSMGSLWGTGIIWNGFTSSLPSASFSPPAMNLWWYRLMDPVAFEPSLHEVGPVAPLSAPDAATLQGGDPGDLVFVPEFDEP